MVGRMVSEAFEARYDRMNVLLPCISENYAAAVRSDGQSITVIYWKEDRIARVSSVSGCIL